MDPLLADLNDAQQRAVLHGTGPLMVVAGAGSGKTRVVTRRIARLIRDGEDPGSILAVTFTNKAAGEMARRVRSLEGGYVRVATFHSACARFLRQDGHHLGYPSGFTIYDTYDRDSGIKTLLGDLGIRTKVTPGEIGRRISRLKNEGIRPGDFDGGFSELDQVVKRVYAPYQQKLKQHAAMDFDDLLLVFHDLLVEFPAVAEAYQRRYRWVLVDEFQDTNRVQYAIARTLGGGVEKNLCVVGDPDQSIYRFRGAEIGNLLGFQDDFADATVVRLESNYRSTATILRAAQAVIENNTERLDKTLVPVREAGEQIGFFVANSADEEARFVCKAVAARLAEGASPEDLAVFYRAHHLSRMLEEQFRRAGIDYKLVGGVTFYDRREIKDLLAYLRVTVNPLDDVSMERAINTPPRGIGPTTLAALRARAASEGMSLCEAVLDEGVRAEQKPKVRSKLGELAAAIEAARAEARTSARGALEAILTHTKYVEFACTLGDLADYSREENIQELVSDAEMHDSGEGGGLPGWLQIVALLTSEDLAGDQPSVTLMTVHAAKGLEFEHAWLTGLEEGVFPHSRALGSDAELQEERRLMYVAMTRAKTTLTLSRAKVRTVAGQTDRQLPSRFLREIPPDCTVRAMETGERYVPAWAEAGGESGFDGGDDAEAVVARLSGDNLRLGMQVVHPVYGRGVVLRTAGRGVQARVLVRFGDGAERNLLLEYANLRIEGEDVEC